MASRPSLCPAEENPGAGTLLQLRDPGGNFLLEWYAGDYFPNIYSTYKIDEIKIEDITFKCGLAQTNTGYDVSSCDVSNGNITEQQCAVTCGTGYSGEARARCNTYNGSFAFTGCQ